MNMFELITSINILLLIIHIFMLKSKFSNKLKKHEEDYNYHINNIHDWQNKILTRLNNIDSFNIKLLEKDFNLISFFSRDDIEMCLARYDIKNHIKDVIRFIISSHNYELNIVIIKHLHNKICNEKFNINDNNLLNSFYEYGVMMSSLDNKTNSIFNMIKHILQCCDFTHKEKV